MLCNLQVTSAFAILTLLFWKYSTLGCTQSHGNLGSEIYNVTGGDNLLLINLVLNSAKKKAAVTISELFIKIGKWSNGLDIWVEILWLTFQQSHKVQTAQKKFYYNVYEFMARNYEFLPS